MWWEVLVAVLTLLRRLGGNREPLQACPGAVEHGVLVELLETGVGEGQPPQAALAGLCTPEAQSGIQDISRGGPALRGRSPWMVEAHVVPACLGRKLSLELSLLPGEWQAAGSSPPRFLPSLRLPRCWAPSQLCPQGLRTQPRRTRPTASWPSCTR